MYWSYQLSTSSAFSGAWASPAGAGMRFTIDSVTSETPCPVFAEINSASVASRPITSSISCITRSGSAAGRSTLFSTGMISRSWSRAR